LLIALACAGACSGSDHSGAAPVAPSSTGAGTTAAGVRATAARTIAAGRLVISELHGSYTMLLTVNPDDLSDRRPIARVEHAPNWPPRAAVAPGGDLVAYTVLSSTTGSPDSDATLWIVSLAERKPWKVAQHVDARTTPVWAPDGSHVIYQSAIPGAAGSLVATVFEVDVRDGKSQTLAEATPPVRFFPVGYAPDSARVYLVRFERGGAYLDEINARTRAARRVARLADGAARDCELTPAADRMLYLALGSAPVRYQAYAVDIANGDVKPVLSGQERTEDVGVAWRPGNPPIATVGLLGGGAGTTGRVMLAGGEGAALVTDARGFDVPVAWSPDGRTLYARSFTGSSADDPGSEQPVLIDTEGARRPLTGDGPVEYVGWATHAP
jgi:hypothetical protein